MRVIGVLAFTEQVLRDVAELRWTLDRLGYSTRLMQIGYEITPEHIGYFEEDAVVLWLGRCYGDPGRCRELAEWYVRDEVDLILAMGVPAARLAQAAVGSRSIPIVFTHVTDPLGEGLIGPTRSQQGRLTGVQNIWLETIGERLDLLLQVVPSPRSVYALYNPQIPEVASQIAALQQATHQRGMKLVSQEVHSSDQARAAVSSLRVSPDGALIRLDDPTVAPLAGLLGAIAREQQAAYVGLHLSELDRHGALLVLDQRGVGAQAARIAHEIFQGTPVEAIPVARPPRTVLGLNLQAANDLGLVVSPQLLGQADVLIPARPRVYLGGRLLLPLASSSLLLAAAGAYAARYGPLYLAGVILAGGLTWSLALWLYLDRRIIRPIRSLTMVAEKIGAGDLDVAIGEVRIEDEIGVLARTLRRMRNNLRSSYAELEKLAGALEEQYEESRAAYRRLQETQRELERASRRIIEADDNARFALTTYIHDEILRPIDELVHAAQAAGDLAILELAHTLEQRMRRLRFDLSAPIACDMRVELRRLLQEALPQLYPSAGRVRLSLDLTQFDRAGELAPPLRFLIYRFASGAASNVYRHANATCLEIQATVEDGHLTLRISDDGRGFDPHDVEKFIQEGHYFFHDIQIRASQLGGSFDLDSAPGRGTRLQVSVPLSTNTGPTPPRTSRRRHRR